MADNPRISTPEVCELAGYSPATLWRRIDAGHMPAPIDRGGKGFIFDRKAVRAALGLDRHEVEIAAPDGSFDPAAFHEALARRVRRDKGARWRDGQGLLPGPGQAAPLRLVGGYTVAPDGRAAGQPQ